jgi:hypothetical protein
MAGTWNALVAFAPWLLITYGLWKALDAVLCRYASRDREARQRWASAIESETAQIPPREFWRQIEAACASHVVRSAFFSAGTLAVGLACLWVRRTP